MGFMLVLGPCYRCHRTFSYNADWVPSVIPTGGSHADRAPLCRDCVVVLNRLRVEAGLPEIVIHRDAYEAQEVG